MFIQINTDNQIEADAERDRAIEERIRTRLGRFEERITAVEIHVSDVNGPREGASDIRCSFEARLTGRDPIAVVDNGANVERAVIGATDKAARAIDRTLGKLTNRKGH